jgi:hypothetical protein
MAKLRIGVDRGAGFCLTAWVLGLAAAGAIAAVPHTANALAFTAGDLVISVYGDGDGSGTYADNSASPITLDELTTTGTQVGQLVLPQSAPVVGGNYPISGEFGSSSEGTLEQSANGQDLVIAGYGVAAATYNANPASYGGATKSCITSGSSSITCFPLAQTSSVPGYAASTAAQNAGYSSTITVPRVVALIDANGNVNTATALTGVYNENNPRSVATVNGSSFYLSGQGASKTDTTTQGVFLAQLGATTATPIDTSFDTRTVEIQNKQLYVSADSSEGSGSHENISSYSTAGNLPTSTSTATILSGLQSKLTVSSSSQLNTLDTSISTGTKIYLSPENYFFANATTLYVADSGAPKSDNNGSGGSAQGLSDGGLQKWTYNGSTWVLDYTLSAGLLNFVPDTTACTSNEVNCGTTGLIGLAGEVVGNTVELFATNATLGDLDQTYLYGIDDSLSALTLPGSESFTVLDTAVSDTLIRGVAFAPVPEPASMALLCGALAGLAAVRRRRVSSTYWIGRVDS